MASTELNGNEKRNGKPASAGLVVRPNEVSIATEPRHRYAEGWRAGRPEEDPDKLKKWGFITAQPSEYLVHMRGGVIRERSSGQGATCFKFPGDSVAVIPTTVQRLHFTADQVTSEKVGVQVTGLAVYRIAEPRIAFRMLNFSFPERAGEKLEQLLSEMFVGAARRLVANLSVEACLTRRKEGLATELMREIAPVVSGSGRPEDRTNVGWGIVIDTIEIQDVRVLSQAVFGAMQAKFRNEQERQAREAELAKERALKGTESESARVIALTTIATEQEVRNQRLAAEERAKLEQLASESRVNESQLERRRAQEQARMAAERELALTRHATELEVARQKQLAEEKSQLEAIAAKTRLEQAQLSLEREIAAAREEARLVELAEAARLEQAKLAQARELAASQERARLEELSAQARFEESKLAHERQLAATRKEAELERLRIEAEQAAEQHQTSLAAIHQQLQATNAHAELATARRRVLEEEVAISELEARRQEAAQKLELTRVERLKAIDNTISPEAIQLAMAQSLPQLAAAFQQKMGEVHVTAVDGANPFGYIAAAVEGVMGLARSAGLELPRKE